MVSYSHANPRRGSAQRDHVKYTNWAAAFLRSPPSPCQRRRSHHTAAIGCPSGGDASDRVHARPRINVGALRRSRRRLVEAATDRVDAGPGRAVRGLRQLPVLTIQPRPTRTGSAIRSDGPFWFKYGGRRQVRMRCRWKGPSAASGSRAFRQDGNFQARVAGHQPSGSLGAGADRLLSQSLVFASSLNR